MSSGREDDEKVSEVSEEVPDEVDEDLSPSEPGGGGDVLSERDDLDWTTKTEEEEEAKLKETEKESHPPPAEPSPSPAPIEETHRPTPQPPSNLPGPSHVPSDPKGNDSPRPSTSNAQEERMERTQSDDDIEELRKQWYAENDNQEEVESGQAEEEKEKDTEKADEKKASEAAQTEDPKGRDKGGERDLPKPAETDAEDTKKKEDTPSPPSPARSVATPEEDKKAVSTTQDAEERKLTEREDERPAAPAKEELSEPLPFPPQKSDSPSAGKESEREAHLQSPEKDEQGKTNVEESQNSPTESPLPNARHAETPPSERVQKDPHPSDKQDSEIKKNLADEQGGQKEFAPSASSKDNVADDATKQEKEKRLPSDLPKAEGHDGTEATEKDSLDEEIEEDVPVPSNAGDAEVAERDLPEGRVAEGKETTEVPKEPVKNESGVETPEEEKKTGGVSADKKDNVERNSEPIDQVKEAPKQTDTPGAASAKREEKQEEEKEGEKRPAHVSRERSLSALEAELTQEEEKAEGKGIKDQGKELSTEKDEETLPLKDSGDPTPAPLSSKTPEVSDSTDGVAQPTPPPETSSGKPPLLASHAPLARLGQRQQAGGRASDPPADPSEAVREREKERERAIRVEKEREMEKAVNGAVNLFAKIRPDGRAANGSTGPTKLKALDSRANKSLELMKSEREAAKAKTKELEENEDDNKDKDTPLDALNSSVRRLSFGKSTQAEGVSVHGQNEPASPSVSSRGKKEQDSRAAAVAKSVSAADAIFLQLNPRDVLPPFAVGPGVSASGSANFDKAIREAARLPLEASAELVRVLVQTDADTLVGSAERSAAYAQAKRGDVGRQGGGTGARTEFGEGQAGLIRVFQVLLAKFAKGHATLRQRVQGGREKLQSVQV
uniref:Uncharacterized protein n=1 Tax=Chromera velia CCMP2878 TaxID=1169474 RepID=A0A0G4F5L8_9ALVE|eukprot:Cvel_15283.t1-p1 / transcript=Cvel_15283.t1 / gene=Cvel_15283 / organism=Chromera_velia_CCMP2878 / gene_product=Cell surface glycoprotein 1, putative / transcript_product=Cell surface glycoprotein 1, putative / location=Cvel_scaffold1121:35585-38272(-) / protein_length=896 / sequence_SO=supercontig / SO=protein_coding / is_pseudo=false